MKGRLTVLKIFGTLALGPVFGSVAAGVHIGGGGTFGDALIAYFLIGMAAILAIGIPRAWIAGHARVVPTSP